MLLIFKMCKDITMSEFSSVFSRHVHRKNIKTYALAQYCGFDRSNMYKIINGKRSPSSGEMVQKISKFMQLEYSAVAEPPNLLE